MIYPCDICGRELCNDINAEGLKDYFGNRLILCQLHYETIKVIAPDGRYNAIALTHATLALNHIRPSLDDDDQKWIDYNPVQELIRLYKEKLENPKIIKDWETYKKSKNVS